MTATVDGLLDAKIQAASSYLKSIVSSLIDYPDQVAVAGSLDEKGVLLSLGLAPSDMPKVIGKGGSTALAVRSLLRVYGGRNDMRISMKILEPGVN